MVVFLFALALVVLPCVAARTVGYWAAMVTFLVGMGALLGVGLYGLTTVAG